MTVNKEELYTIIDRSLDEAMINGRFMFKMYDYLKINKWTRKDVGEFMESSVFGEVLGAVSELDDYLHGDKVMREAYGHISKPNARKRFNYLSSLVEETRQYHTDRRPGRKKGSKNKKS